MKKMSQKIRLLAAAALLSLVVLVSVAAQTKGKTADAVKKGHDLYAHYCVSCHGQSAKGDGPAASALKVPPADLTNIGRRYNGFPEEKMMLYIDGEKYAVGHGSREMPVWGKRFRRPEGKETATSGEVFALTKYLESIQTK